MDADIDSLGIKALKEYITAAGLSVAGCIDKEDLRLRAREPLARAGRHAVEGRKVLGLGAERRREGKAVDADSAGSPRAATKRQAAGP